MPFGWDILYENMFRRRNIAIKIDLYHQVRDVHPIWGSLPIEILSKKQMVFVFLGVDAEAIWK